ncbi:MAG: hypothetical protein NVSMB57_01360 [Actinomycetota bacterium]
MKASGKSIAVRISIGAGLIALFASSLASAPAAAAATTSRADRVVLAGAVNPNNASVPYNYTKFYPSVLQVHRGSTVEWRFHGSVNGWHTISFYPGDMDVSKYPQPSDTVVDAAYRISSLPQYLTFTDQFMLGNEGGTRGVPPSAPCGRGLWLGTFAAQAPCVLRSATQFVSSSLYDRFGDITPEGSFRVTFDLPQGEYRYHCKYHSGMIGSVRVVDASASIPAQSVIDQQAKQEIAKDTAAADALAKRDGNLASAYDAATHTWSIHIGDTTPDRSVIIDDYLPANISVAAGDKVRWVAGGDVHTATFFSGQEQTPGWGFASAGTCGPGSCTSPFGYVGFAGNPLTALDYMLYCRTDVPEIGPVPLTTWSPYTVSCPEGSTVELLSGPFLTREHQGPGNNILPGTFTSSGLMMRADLPEQFRARGDGTYFSSKFAVNVPVSGDYYFFCKVHPDWMTGKIHVNA